MVKRVVSLAIAFATFILVMVLAHIFIAPDGIKRVNVLKDGWTVSYNDTVYTDVSLPDLRNLIGNPTFRGDRIVLSHEVTGLSDYEAPTLLFETNFSAYTVTCGHKVIRSVFYELYEKGAFIGSDNNYVLLPTFTEPVILEIELLVSEDGAYGYYNSPVLGSYMDVFLYTIYENIFIFMSSAFLVIFGIMFLAIAVGFKSDLPEINMQMYSALLFIMLGIWSLTQFRVADMFMDTHGHQTEIEYISLYLIVPLMYMTMGSMQNYLKNKLFLIFATIGTLIPVVLIALHYMGLVHINRLLFVYQLDALGLVIFMVTMLVRDISNRRISGSQLIQLIGATALAVSFVFNVFFYFLEVNGVSEQIMLSKKAVPIGTMCMVFATLVNYNIFITESYARKKEYDSLAHLAYADGLTGIPNRSRFEKYLNDLWDMEEDYCVISIDLNGLKVVNDTLGHLMGDKYLSEFTEVLVDCFKEKGFVARIGGDEFVAILRGENMSMADELLKKLDQSLEDINKKDPSINRSAASGYAFRHEADKKDWNEVYLLADERMYKNKADKKSQRKD